MSCDESSCSSCQKAGNCEEEKKKVNPSIKHVIAIMSGKGGVGKSSVTGLLASYLNKKGYTVGILDADITGPSIPTLFGIGKKHAATEGENIKPVKTENGIEVMSINLLLEKEDDPVIWRGPIIASAIQQFWTDVAWGELDYLLVDLPPGTGDAPLTVMQQIPLEGVIIVSLPQDLVSLIVKKNINMVRQIKLPIIGVVENQSFLTCPHCHTEIPLHRKKGAPEYELGVDMLGQLPVDPELAELCDHGKIDEYLNGDNPFDAVGEKILGKLNK